MFKNMLPYIQCVSGYESMKIQKNYLVFKITMLNINLLEHNSDWKKTFIGHSSGSFVTLTFCTTDNSQHCRKFHKNAGLIQVTP